ncbi:carbohydrate ABC transporter permease [Phytoactinopolyspora limicola]|uniref:carbohydrate ABC transporter permease n=1 Tax=Phytoactinopolyspora limicola TaxID=2715536 RepID=UPI00140BAA5B|nr:sugar ABC transporter permease [Phytoactinopolyspora limicola]
MKTPVRESATRIPAATGYRPPLGRRLTPLAFIAPAVIVLLVVLGYPVANAIWTSLNYEVATAPDAREFAGLGNFREIFADRAFAGAAMRSAVWAFANLVLQLTIGLIIASVLNQRLRARAMVRSIVIIPWVVPTVVVALIWRFIMDPTSGPLNDVLRSTGIMSEPPLWLADTDWAFPVLILVSVWKWTPFVAVILLAGLQTVPDEVREAALIDGATSFQRFRYVIVPHISTSIAMASVLTIAYSINNFAGIWLFTRGGPAGSTETLTTLAYRYAFAEFDFGKAAAVAFVLFVFVFIVSCVYFYIVEGRRK